LVLVLIFEYKIFSPNDGKISNLLSNLPFDAVILLLISNATIFFQDWIMFLGVSNGHLVFVSNFQIEDVQLYKELLIPQAWSLGVELTFYLIAPFIIRRKNLLICIFIGSIALRIFIIKMGFGLTDPWTYRFFPTELAFFILGAFSHQFLLPLFKRLLKTNIEKVGRYITFGMIAYVCVYFLIPGDKAFKSLLLFSIFVIALPFAFLYQSKSPIDKWIGELSYPIYICHSFVIWFVNESIGLNMGNEKLSLAIISVVASIAFSVVILLFIELPIEKFRKSYVGNLI
jgi:peptidoglycan/LPS O-acetylase OafA/YrhL